MEAVEATVYMERVQPALFARTFVAAGVDYGCSISKVVGSFALLTIG
jgi:hypothetical protein